MNATAQTLVLATDSMTAKQRDFANFYVQCRNATTAYRMAYDCDPAKEGGRWVGVEAARTLALPCVAAHVAELQEAAAATTIIKARELVQDLVDMASVDPEEVTSVRTINCRHCWGTDGRYQWRDEAELSIDCEQAQDRVDQGVKHVKFPDAGGGFGYTPSKGPNPECAKCNGAGLILGAVVDSRKWSVKARKLVKGVKQTANGIEVLMNDPLAVRIELAKILGLYGKDITLNPAEPDAPVAADATEAQAANGYLEMLG